MTEALNYNKPTRFGQWVREKVLGKGAFGMVTLWKNSQTGDRIAIKKLNLGSEKENERWRTEVQLIKEANHPNIVTFIQVPVDLLNEFPSRNSLGMEYCSIGDLRKFLSLNTEYCCGLPESILRNMFSNLSSAICYLHENNSMHRDLKPENIVITQKNNKLVFKITDLGYARHLNDGSVAQSYVGTMYYLAPEILSAAKDELHYIKSVDYWSFGVLSFECITGYRPFCPNYEPAVALKYIQGKDDDQLAILLDTRENRPTDHVARYLTSLPEPHSLNPLFAKDITIWLKSMLQTKPETRGGGNYRSWSSQLSGYLAKQYLTVIDTTSMKPMDYHITQTDTVTMFQNKIKQDTNLELSEQLLLLKQGETLNVTQFLMHYCTNEYANNAGKFTMFLFSLRKGNQHNYVDVPLPDYLIQVLNAELFSVTGNERQYLAFAYDFVLKRTQWCNTIALALESLDQSIIKHRNNLLKRTQRLHDAVCLFDIQVKVFQECFNTHHLKYREFQESSGYEDGAFENVLRSSEQELQDAMKLTQEIKQFIERVHLIENKYQNIVTEARAVSKKYRSHRWKLDELGLEYSKKRRAIKECPTKPDRLKLVEKFITEKASTVNETVNDYVKQFYFEIQRLIICYSEIKPANLQADTLLHRYDQIKNMPEQKKLRDGIWNMLQPIAEAANAINQYEHEMLPGEDLIDDLRRAVDNLL